MLKLKDAVVVVTGGGSGIGEALAKEAGRRGAKVAVADIELDAAKRVAEEIAAGGTEAEAFQADMSDVEAVNALAKAVEARFGKVNVLFNNAGVFPMGPLEKTSLENFTWVFNVNVFGMFYAIKAFLPLIKQQAEAGETACIVNTGSENSLCVPSFGQHSAYTATKHAVLGLTDCLRRDLKDTGVQVALLCPGPVKTNLWNSFRTRHEKFGGARHAPPEWAEGMSLDQLPDEVAQLTFAGLDAGEFIIITTFRIVPDTDKRLAEVALGYEKLKERSQ